MDKIIITGGAGFIGSHVCERLLDEGRYVVCVDDFNDYYRPEIKERNIKNCLKSNRFSLHRLDIRDENKLDTVFKKEKIDKIIHLAARAGVRASLKEPQLYFSVNIGGTLNLLDMARRHKISQFIFSSSSSVYGTNKKIPFSEEDKAGNQVSPYAVSKKVAELLCHSYSKIYKLRVICLRLFTVYGPRGRPDMAPYKFTEKILNQQAIEMYGNGSSQRDYTYVGDIVEGIVKTLSCEREFEIINLGNSEPVKLIEFINIIEDLLGKKADIIQKPMPRGDVPITYADNSKASKILNWRPKTDIMEGMKRFIAWYRLESKSG
ncbi:SDR family NAD(P)-dependent oxidoreductase [Candidatus Woesearchaeota archaeon]|nr:SDR family NAD(P)-dependent oxidoreductase [Candidatus Woesearchaeota archaeon]